MGSDLIEQKTLFSKEECDYLKTLFSDDDFQRSRITDNKSHGEYSNTRTSYDIFLPFGVDNKNVLIDKLRENGIYGTVYSFTVLRYDIGQEFKKHRDNGGAHSKRYEKRYKTVIIQLSNEDEYEGGDLVIYNNDEEITASKEIGNTIIFHSSLEHELKKLTKGRRYCIVFWLEKENFKLKYDLI
jgi:PKHD-type hydroxylase